MKKSWCILCAAFLIFVLGACFSPWESSGNLGTITINMGNSGARLMVSDAEKAEMEYTMILSASGGRTMTAQFTGGTAVITAPPGKWNIKIRAEGKTPDEYLDAGFPARMLRGVGETEKPVEVKAGATVAAIINMTVVTEVATWEQLRAAFALTGVKPEIVMITAGSLEADNTAFAGLTENDWPFYSQRITLRAEKEVTITRTDEFSGSLFEVRPSGVLTLGGGKITLSGNGNRGSQSLISVYGELIMSDGVTLNGNTAQNGGGISVSGGTFIMDGGTISGNTASGFGGGVYMDGGSFSKTGGTIYGNTARDTAGHAVYVSGKVIKYKDKPSAPGDNLSYNFNNGSPLFTGNWDGDPEPPIDDAPVTITFTGFGPETVNLNDIANPVKRNTTINVTVEGVYDSYSWYLDGIPQRNYINNDYNFFVPDDFPIGAHTLTAVVQKNGVPYSKEVFFTVEN